VTKVSRSTQVAEELLVMRKKSGCWQDFVNHGPTYHSEKHSVNELMTFFQFYLDVEREVRSCENMDERWFYRVLLSMLI
jgi:hypothetical protein